MRNTIKNKLPLLFVMATTFLILFMIFSELHMKGLTFISNSDAKIQYIPLYLFRNALIDRDVLFPEWTWSFLFGMDYASIVGRISQGDIFSYIYYFANLTNIDVFIEIAEYLKHLIGAFIMFIYLKKYMKLSNVVVIIFTILWIFNSWGTAHFQHYYFRSFLFLFPLILIAVEEFLINKRKYPFIFSVALLSFVSYHFLHLKQQLAIILFL